MENMENMENTESMRRSRFNFSKKAQEVVTRSFSGDADLEECVVEQVKEAGLNPREAVRLTEEVNKEATLRFLSTAPDKTASFPLADPASVTAKTHGDPLPGAQASAVEETEKTASNDTLHFPDPGERDPEVFKKTASAPVEVPVNSVAELFCLQNTAFQKQAEHMTAVESAQSGYEELLAVFSTFRPPDFWKFAHDVTAVLRRPGELLSEKLGQDLDLDDGQKEKGYEAADEEDPLVKKAEVLVHNLLRAADLKAECLRSEALVGRKTAEILGCGPE